MIECDQIIHSRFPYLLFINYFWTNDMLAIIYDMLAIIYDIISSYIFSYYV